MLRSDTPVVVSRADGQTVVSRADGQTVVNRYRRLPNGTLVCERTTTDSAPDFARIVAVHIPSRRPSRTRRSRRGT